MSPLKKGSSKAVIAANIQECMRAGKHTRAQCIAMAMRSAGKTKPKRKIKKKKKIVRKRRTRQR